VLSIYRLFGGIGLVLLGASLLLGQMPNAVKIAAGVCLVIAGVALLVGI
jgi:hypothetical protein